MQKLLHITTLAAMALAMCIVNDANAQWPEYTQVNNKNYIEIGGRAFNRPGTDLDLSIVEDSVTGQTLFSANQATAAASAAGVELSYHFATRLGRQLEFRTFTGTWDSNTFIDGGNISSSLFPGQVADSFDYNYDSQIFSFELNQKRALFPGLTFFGGPRFLSFRDEISFVATVDADPPATLFAGETRQSFEAINNLIGLQAGLRYEKAVNNFIRGAGFIRTGGYFNPTTVRTSAQTGVVGLPPMTLLNTEATKATGSFLAEVGGKVYVDFARGCSVFAGYEGTWIDGVALAPPSFLTQDTGEVETANTLFFHAITFGFRFGW